jgi:hypothetical protein
VYNDEIINNLQEVKQGKKKSKSVLKKIKNYFKINSITRMTSIIARKNKTRK